MLLVQELGIVTWAFATVKQSDEKLFTSLAGAAERGRALQAGVERLGLPGVREAWGRGLVVRKA